jgi:hypothetical protein
VLGFDWPVLRRHVHRWLGTKLPWPANIWDTGLVEKAIAGNLPLSNQETTLQLFERFADTPASVPWSLDYCLQDPGLSVGVDRQDCRYRVWAIHTLYQSQRTTLLAAGRQGPPGCW